MTMTTLESVCTDCRLLYCDEDSIWCVYRWATQPNDAQKQLRQKEGRKAYYARYYRENRDRKLAAANKRNADRREAEVLG